MTFQQLVCLLHAHYTCCKKNKICIHVWPHDCLPPLNVWIRSSTMPRLKITDTQVNFQWTFSGIHGNPFMHSVVPRAIHCFSMCVWSTVKRIIHASVRDHEKKWDSRPRCRQTFWVSLCPTPALWAGHSSAALQSASLRFCTVLYRSTALTSFLSIFGLCTGLHLFIHFTSQSILCTGFTGKNWITNWWSLIDIRSWIWVNRAFHLFLCFGQSRCCWVYIWDL